MEIHKESIIDSLRQAWDKIKSVSTSTATGKLVIIIGNKGTGKSETIKYLCKHISGHKFIIAPDSTLQPRPLHPDDKKEYSAIPNCHPVEGQTIEWQPGLYVLEDFPSLDKDAEQELYNLLKDARHEGMTFVIVAHQYKAINKRIFDFADYILLYKNATITAHQLAPKIGGMGNGWAVQRGIKQLKQYQYYLISCDDHKWHNPPLDSRNAEVLRRAVRGWLKPAELSDISFPKQTTTSSTSNRKTKKQTIQRMIQDGKSYNDILQAVKAQYDSATSEAYIWKIKCEMRKAYRTEHALQDNIPEQRYPTYLQDNRRT